MIPVQGRCRHLFLALCLISFALSTPARGQVRPGDFDVTDGKIQAAKGRRLSVSTKEMRATLKFSTEQAATVKFTYLGPTKEVARLGSGEVRSQFGIKLRAQNDCNVIYVMWHFAPDQKIAVSIKRNPGKRTHAQCLDRGYINNVKPRLSDSPPPLEPNQPHVLTATMSGSDLSVTADNKLVWWGNLGPIALALRGTVGLRSDNARPPLRLPRHPLTPLSSFHYVPSQGLQPRPSPALVIPSAARDPGLISTLFVSMRSPRSCV